MGRSSFILALASAILTLPLLAAAAADPFVGKWICKEPLGDGSKFGFQLKQDGKAEAIGTATMQIERWRRIDDKHIAITEVSVGNGITTRDICMYDARVTNDGVLVLRSATGWYSGKFSHTE